MNNASQAALAALSIHNKNAQDNQHQQQYNPSLQAYQASGRANSLAGGHRSNSMRSYTYNPKPSYQTGPANTRSYSLRSNSLRGAPPVRSNSLSQRPTPAAGRQAPSQRANSLTARQPPVARSGSLTRSPLSQRAGSLTGSHRGLNSMSGFNEEEEEYNDDDVISSTKTTKVVDSMGRTCSITTETIRTLPDGSNVVETTTKNLSRSGSRSNSMRNNSMSLAHSNANYNLNKIEEDLQDFDYNYLDQPPSQPPKLNLGHHEPQQSPQKQPQSLGPAFEGSRRSSDYGQHPPPPSQQPSQYPQQQAAQGPRGRHEVSGSPSTSTSPRLKSILKQSPHVAHLNSPPNPEADRLKNSLSPNEEDFKDASEKLNYHKSPPLKPTVASNASGGNSIKFLEQVETIPYESNNHNYAEVQRAEALKQAKEKQEGINMYEQAMKVAMAKVYGSNDGGTSALTPPQSPQVNQNQDSNGQFDKLVDNKIKKDQKREKDDGGVRSNYIYENHHKDFAMHSLRGEDEPGQTSRKERAKEEKKQQKDEEKKRNDLLKQAQKEKKNVEKEEAKRHRKTSKNPLSFLGIKMRRGSSGSIASSSAGGVRQEKGHEEGSQFSSESGNRLTSQPVGAIQEGQSPTQGPKDDDTAGQARSTGDVPAAAYDFPPKETQRSVEPQAQSVNYTAPSGPQQQQEQSSINTPKTPVEPTFGQSINQIAADSPSEDVFTQPERHDISVPPRSPLRDAHAVEREKHLRSLSEGSNMTDFLNSGPAVQPPATLGEADEAFHDSRDDFIDVPEEYGGEEALQADNGAPDTLNDEESFKVIHVPASSREEDNIVDDASPSAAKANPTEPVPSTAEVPERSTSTEPSASTEPSRGAIFGSVSRKKGEETTQGQVSQSDLPTIVSGEKGHPVVLGSSAQEEPTTTYSTLDPGSPTSNRRRVPTAIDDTATISSSESAVDVPVPEKDTVAERAQVNPQIATTSAGALEPDAAAETRFDPNQTSISGTTESQPAAHEKETTEKEATGSSNVNNDPLAAGAIAIGTAGLDKQQPVPDSLGVRHATEEAQKEQPSHSSGEATEVSVPSQQEKNKKPKKPKGRKFKKMIDKYFISSYSR
ncbi:hypothetical protein FT663_03738 [Candidozyma haemuli var. vulneris]|nr:hypothetical protein FT662_03907 [[Candida] haemuloni var. vulneris]KAF3989141.1 hypothetical protein FT663_03738 [[Candida] haemuloni var. vulneris]